MESRLREDGEVELRKLALRVILEIYSDREDLRVALNNLEFQWGGIMTSLSADSAAMGLVTCYHVGRVVGSV